MIIPNGRIDILSLLIGMKIGGGGQEVAQNVFYCECPNPAYMSTKSAQVADGGTLPDTLQKGLIVLVKFSNENSATSPRLKVGNLPDKQISISGGGDGVAAPVNYWKPGEIIPFVYDGNNWRIVDGGTADSTYYGISAPTAS